MLIHKLEGKVFSEVEKTIYARLFLEYCILGGMHAISGITFKRKCE